MAGSAAAFGRAERQSVDAPSYALLSRLRNHAKDITSPCPSRKGFGQESGEDPASWPGLLKNGLISAENYSVSSSGGSSGGASPSSPFSSSSSVIRSAVISVSSESALARLRGLYEGIAATPAFIGICYTQLTDVEQEINGLMTYDRKLKFDASRLREINGLLQ